MNCCYSSGTRSFVIAVAVVAGRQTARRTQLSQSSMTRCQIYVWKLWHCRALICHLLWVVLWSNRYVWAVLCGEKQSLKTLSKSSGTDFYDLCCWKLNFSWFFTKMTKIGVFDEFWTFSVKICGFGVQIRETSVRTCQKHGTLSFITSCVACFGKLMTP